MEDRKYDCLIAFNAATPEERYAAREAVLRSKGTPMQWAISEGQNIARDIAEDAERAALPIEGPTEEPEPLDAALARIAGRASPTAAGAE